VLCKSQEAVTLFRRLGCRAEHVGFTTPDARDLPPPPAPAPACLHVAGRSLLKGTESLLRLWERHPEWPALVVVQRAPQPHIPIPVTTARNVTLHHQYVAEADLRTMRNAIPIHLAPSRAEGFGHSIAEGLSCGAVVVTTDAPPMNELVTPERGLLVRTRGRPVAHGLGLVHQLDEADLERQVSRALSLAPGEAAALGRRGRAWYEANDAAFRRRFLAALAGLGQTATAQGNAAAQQFGTNAGNLMVQGGDARAAAAINNANAWTGALNNLSAWAYGTPGAWGR